MGSFSIPIYILAILVQTSGDILLTTLAAKIKSTTRSMAEASEKKLVGQTIQKVEIFDKEFLEDL
jgi:hypothetical protein